MLQRRNSIPASITSVLYYIRCVIINTTLGKKGLLLQVKNATMCSYASLVCNCLMPPLLGNSFNFRHSALALPLAVLFISTYMS